MQECCIIKLAVEILKAAIEQTSINIDRNFDTFYRSEFKIPLVIEIYILLAFKSLI